MQTINVEKAVAVIQAEHKLIGGNWVERCENPGRCALAALLFAAGMPDKDMVLHGEPVDWTLGSRPAELLNDAYGLRRWHADQIMTVNDATRDDNSAAIARRRQQVIERVTSFASAPNWAECDRFDDQREEHDFYDDL